MKNKYFLSAYVVAVIASMNESADAFVISAPFDFSMGALTGGIDGELGAEYTFTGVGTTDGSNRVVNAVVRITGLTDVTQVRRTPISNISSDGNTITPNSVNQLIFAITATPQTSSGVTPVLNFSLDFSFDDDDSAAVLSNLGVSVGDIDSQTGSQRLYSEFIAVADGQLLSSEFSANTQLEIDTTTLAGFTAAQLVDFSEGNFSSNVNNNSATGSTDSDDFTATFNLNASSSFDLAFGLTGDSSNTEGNRGGTFSFSTSIPEPSSALLLGVALLSGCLRRNCRNR